MKKITCLLCLLMIMSTRGNSQSCMASPFIFYDTPHHCVGELVTIGAAPGFATYQWTCPGGTCPTGFNPSGDYSSFIATSTSLNGVYKVTVTDGIGCTTTDSVTLTINPVPGALVSGVTTGCEGTPGYYTVDNGDPGNLYGPYTYVWDGGATTQQINFTFGVGFAPGPSVQVTNGFGCSVYSPFSPPYNGLPLPYEAEITASGSTKFCNGGSVALNATPSSGYQWKKGGNILPGASTDQSYIASLGGSYSVVVSNIYGCTRESAPVNVTLTSAISTALTAGGGLTVCKGDSLMLYAYTCSGLTYQWKKNGIDIPGATSSSYAAKTSGYYKVAITDVNGTIISSTKHVTVVNLQPYAITSAGGPTAFCENLSVNLSSGAHPDLFYNWYRDGNYYAGGSTINANVSGDYAVHVSDTNNCVAVSAPVTVTVYPLPKAKATIEDSPYFCQGDNVTFTANAGVNLTYQWYNTDPIAGADDIHYTATATGFYYVQVTDSNGCEAFSNSFQVEVSATPNQNIAMGIPGVCNGTPVPLYAYHCSSGGYTYEWYKNGSIITGATSYFYFAGSPGNYKAKIIWASGSLHTYIAHVITDPPATLFTYYNTDICPGESVTLQTNSDPSYSYQWRKNGADIINPGFNPWIYLADATGNYRVEITNADGCSHISNLISVNVANPVATVTPDGPIIFCSGGSVILDANTGSGLTYQWIKNGVPISGATDSSYEVNASGYYKVTVTKNFNCSVTSSAIHVKVNSLPSAPINASGPLTFCAGGSVTFTTSSGTGYTYQWLKDNVPVAGATAVSYTAFVAGVYKVMVTNADGCTKMSGMKTVTVPCRINGENSYENNSITAFPDPVKDVLYLDFKAIAGKETIYIINALGQTVLTDEKDFGNTRLKEINMNAIAPGIYTVIVKGRQEMKMIRIVKQ